MKAVTRHLSLALLLSVLSLSAVFAQTRMYAEGEHQANPNSVRPVRYDDVMWKRSLWMRMNLLWKANEGFWAQGYELPRLIIDAVRDDIIQPPFKTDNLVERYTKDEFLEMLMKPESGMDLQTAQLERQKRIDEAVTYGLDTTEIATVEELMAAEEYAVRPSMYQIEIKEDLIFDRAESRMKHDIQALSIVIENELKGLDEYLGFFSYKDLTEDLFKVHPAARWFNPKNGAKHMRLDQAFDLRLFDAYLVKYENPRDATIVDLVSKYHKGDAQRQAVYESQRILHELVEFEALLWEY